MAENQNLEKQLSELAEFLVKARKETFSLEDTKIERPRHTKSEYQNGQFCYLNNCDGLYQIWDREEIRSKKHGTTIFALTLSGALDPEFHVDNQENRGLALENLAFFRKARSNFSEKIYLKGLNPNASLREKIELKKTSNLSVYADNDWLLLYQIATGNIKDLNGEGDIHHNDRHIFKYEFTGGIII